MNIFKERWPKLKQELVPLTLFSTIQVWWNFNWPSFVKFGTPWNIIIGVITSIISVAMYVYVFAYADKLSSLFDHDDSNYAMVPYAHIMKAAQKIIFVSVFSFTMMYIWYKNLYNMPNIYYALFYAYCALAFVLIWRASRRRP